MGGQKIHLLLVEDDKVDQMAFARFVKDEKLSYEYTIARSIAESEKLITSKDFDIVISDYILEDGTLFDLFDLLKDIPVIVITGAGSEGIAIKAMKLGAWDYLIKDPEGRYLKTLPFTVESAVKRKQAEAALRESEQKLRTITDTAVDSIFCKDTNRRYTFVNPSMLQLLGCTKADLIGKVPEEVFAKEDAAIVNAVDERTLNGENISAVRSLSISGKPYTFHTIQVPLRDAGGNITGISGIVRDITDFMRAEESLQKEKERFRILVEESPFGVSLISKDGRYEYINSKFVKIFGYTLEDIPTGREWFKKAFPNREYKTQVISTWINEQKESPVWEARPRTFKVKCKDGSEKEIHFRPVTLENEQQLVIYEDVTEQKKMEEALRESEEKLARSKKMESLGLLAGGVAHDLNNVLSGIVSYPELLLLDLPEESKLRKPIETIQASGHRAAAIVHDLLTVARGVATIKEPLNLNDLVSDYFNSLEFTKLKQFYPTVTVKTNLDTDLLNIGGSHVHIRKVMMSLMSNASEAIEGRGTVMVSTVNRYIDRPLDGYDDVNIGEYVVLVVSDNGSGISSEDRERIFEPFYTKKVMGRIGTGLGLAVVWNIVQDHNGYIDVISDENGTTFELYFPITRDELSGKDLSVPIKNYKGNGETILVVDDVESQREISSKMLDTLGYKTKAISSGEEAVEYLKEHTVDLILLDMIMDPGINGRETYERILKIHPDQKAIIASGYAETDDVKEAQKLGAGRYIKKPLTLEKMGIAVKEELGK